MAVIVVDQVLVSLVTIVVTLAAAHIGGVAGATQVLVIQTSYVIGVTAARVLLTEPLLTTERKVIESFRGVVHGVCVLTGTPAALLTVLIVTGVFGPSQLTLCLILILAGVAQDSERVLGLRDRRILIVTCCDVIPLAAILFGALRWHSVNALLTSWTVALLVSAFALLSSIARSECRVHGTPRECCATTGAILDTERSTA